jgi:nitric oxide reductase NorQ protein
MSDILQLVDADIEVVQKYVDEHIVGDQTMTAKEVYAAVSKKLTKPLAEGTFAAVFSATVKADRITGIGAKRRVGYFREGVVHARPAPEPTKEKEAAVETPASEPPSAKLSGFTVEKIDRGIMWVGEDKNFYVAPENKQMFDVVEKLAATAPQNIMFTGPQGCGKTELCIWYAAKYNRPLIVMNCATIRETRDWFGYRDAKDGSLYWHKSDFVRAIELGGCTVVLDEFNRLHATLHNTLYPLLDARRSTFVEEIGEVVAVGPGTVFFATCNLGFSHTGTHTMDSAMEDRFGYRIDLTFPTTEIESKILLSKCGIDVPLAIKLAKLGEVVRAKADGAGATLSRAISTRQLLNTGILMRQFQVQKLDLQSAFDYTIVPTYSKEGGRDSEQGQVLQMIQGIFGSRVKK